MMFDQSNPQMAQLLAMLQGGGMGGGGMGGPAMPQNMSPQIPIAPPSQGAAGAPAGVAPQLPQSGGGQPGQGGMFQNMGGAAGGMNPMMMAAMMKRGPGQPQQSDNPFANMMSPKMPGTDAPPGLQQMPPGVQSPTSGGGGHSGGDGMLQKLFATLFGGVSGLGASFIK